MELNDTSVDVGALDAADAAAAAALTGLSSDIVAVRSVICRYGYMHKSAQRGHSHCVLLLCLARVAISVACLSRLVWSTLRL
jgi:hypothetical protein